MHHNNAVAGNQVTTIPDLVMTSVVAPASGFTGGTTWSPIRPRQ
jgi:hypothetical protein